MPKTTAALARRSTKPSDGRNTASPPSPTVYFLDENWGNKVVPPILRAAGMTVELYNDHFAPGTPDATWIPEVVRRGWVILTMDKNLRHKPNEREALVRSSARAFVFSGAGIRGEDAARVVVAAQGKIEQMIATTMPPYVATITRGGDVTIRWPAGKRPPR